MTDLLCITALNRLCLLCCRQGDVEEDEMIPDQQSDIKPRFHKSRTHGQKYQDCAEEVNLQCLISCIMQM